MFPGTSNMNSPVGNYNSTYNYPMAPGNMSFPQWQQAPQITPQVNSPSVKTFVVSSLAEVQAFRVPCDGNLVYFPCPADNCIYTKVVDLSGVPCIQKYVPENVQSANQNFATVDMLSTLAQRVSTLEGAMRNVQPNANASTNATANAESINERVNASTNATAATTNKPKS